MNIREAKEEIKRTAVIYLDKNEYGEYTIPYRKQRPVFMTGAPGIGKTAIIEQVAAEMDIALVSCSMTHHTRQSVLGMPYIAKREYEGRVRQISEYAMSEIIASVYELMKESGRKEGILFLDEINCAPDALMPAILLFLQHKMFGSKRLPEGWVIVTAGNLPEYNRSVKKFDLAVLDRLKSFRVEQDFEAWKLYAYEQRIHPAILSFLIVNPGWFYSFRRAADDSEYVTARGWEDLSRAIRLYEKKGFQVNQKLICPYVTDGQIAEKFQIHYEMFVKCRQQYHAGDILKGMMPSEAMEKGRKAGFEERVSLMELLLEDLNALFAQTAEQEAVLQRAEKLLQTAERQDTEENLPLCAVLYVFHRQLQQERKMRQSANNLSLSQKEEFRKTELLLKRFMEIARKEREPEKQFPTVKKEFEVLGEEHGKKASDVRKALENAFQWIEEMWGKGRELTFFAAELKENTTGKSFMERWGIDFRFRNP